jgi:hypothetical protein
MRTTGSILLLMMTLLVGCDDTVNIDNTSTPTDASVTILIGGQCRTTAGRIECEDSSQSVPDGRLTAVRWDLRSSTTGISQDRTQGDPGGEISFAGLAPDTYEVGQTVIADDGATAVQVHGDLVIE